MKLGSWTPDESIRLIKAVEKQLTDNSGESRAISWPTVSREVGTRTGKQCRERWVNNLNPALSQNPWAAEEEQQLLELFNLYPYQWATISSLMEGRSQNQVKTKYRSLAKKQQKLKEKLENRELLLGKRQRSDSSSSISLSSTATQNVDLTEFLLAEPKPKEIAVDTEVQVSPLNMNMMPTDDFESLLNTP